MVEENTTKSPNEDNLPPKLEPPPNSSSASAGATEGKLVEPKPTVPEPPDEGGAPVEPPVSTLAHEAEAAPAEQEKEPEPVIKEPEPVPFSPVATGAGKPAEIDKQVDLPASVSDQPASPLASTELQRGESLGGRDEQAGAVLPETPSAGSGQASSLQEGRQAGQAPPKSTPLRQGSGLAPPAPAPATSQLVASKESEADFPTRFKDKLKTLLKGARKKRSKKAGEHEKNILEYALEHNRIDNKAARKITGLKDERVRQYLDKLEKKKKLVLMGTDGPKVFYMPIRKK